MDLIMRMSFKPVVFTYLFICEYTGWILLFLIPSLCEVCFCCACWTVVPYGYNFSHLLTFRYSCKHLQLGTNIMWQFVLAFAIYLDASQYLDIVLSWSNFLDEVNFTATFMASNFFFNLIERCLLLICDLSISVFLQVASLGDGVSLEAKLLSRYHAGPIFMRDQIWVHFSILHFGNLA